MSSLSELDPLATEPDVSVVIPARDATATLATAVDSVLIQEGIELVDVVIAAGDPATRAVAEGLRRDPRVRVVTNHAGTTPAGLNRGFREARGQVVARLDAHAVLPPDYLAQAIATMRRTGACNVGGRQDPRGCTRAERAVAAAMRSPAGTGGARYRHAGAEGEVETVYLGVFRKDAVEAVGGFDERLLRNQDFELNHRLRAAGGTVYYDPRLVVAYRPRGSLREVWEQYSEYGRWKREVLRLHPASLKLRQVAAPLLVTAIGCAAAAAVATRNSKPLLPVAVYELGVLAAAAKASDTASDAPMVGVVLQTMHVAWGVGFLVGGARPRVFQVPRSGGHPRGVTAA